MKHETAKDEDKYNLQISNEFFPVNYKPVEVVDTKVKKQNHKYKTRTIFKQMSCGRHAVYFMHCFFVWKQNITEKSKTCNKDCYAKDNKEDIPKAISDFKSHLLSHFNTVNI